MSGTVQQLVNVNVRSSLAQAIEEYYLALSGRPSARHREAGSCVGD